MSRNGQSFNKILGADERQAKALQKMAASGNALQSACHECGASGSKNRLKRVGRFEYCKDHLADARNRQQRVEKRMAEAGNLLEEASWS